MADPDIRNLDWGFTYRSPGETYRVDKHSDAIVTDPDSDFNILEVFLDGTEGFVGIHTEPGKVTLDNGIISIAGVAIGEVEGLNSSQLVVTFNGDATSTRVQELIRALTFTSTAAGGFTGLEMISIFLQDKEGGAETSIVMVADKVSGTGSDETFSATYDVIYDGDELDGGAGNDVLELTGGGVFDLDRMRSFTSIETIRGSADNDFITISGSQLGGVQRIEGGGAVISDRLTIAGLSIDLSGVAIEGFAAIALADHRARIIVDNVATAKLVSGYGTRDDTLTLTSGTLTALERQILHQQGIDTIITNENGRLVSTTHKAPQITSFNGAAINAPVGTTVFLDAGRDAILKVDSILLKSLSVHTLGDFDRAERISVDPGNGVTLSRDGGILRDVLVDDRVIGRVYGAGTASLTFSFNDQATDVRVQKLVRSLTYTKESGTTDKLRKIEFTIEDIGGRKTKAEVALDFSQNAAPSDIMLSSANVRELSPGNTWIGDLSATDAAGSTFTYTLVDDASGRFKIDGHQLKVARGTLLDHEQNKFHSVRIKATDQGGLSYEKSFAIDVDDVGQEIVTGTVGNDVFISGSGRDKLDGGYGNDRLTGGKGKDIFVFKSSLSKTKNVDTITDFNAKDDTIQLENEIFKKLSKAGTLSKSFFTIGSKAKDANDYIVYDQAKGYLLYDADGSGRGKALLFAKLKGTIDNKDFLVI